MKHALISPVEPRHSGYRVAQVEAQPFEIGLPLFWVEVADDVAADTHYYDPATQQCMPVPAPPQPTQQEQALAQIEQLERQTLMNRAVREYLLLDFIKQAATELGITQAQAAVLLYTSNPAFKKVKDLDDQIAALRLVATQGA